MCFFARYTGAHVLHYFMFIMLAQLIIEFGFDFSALEDGAEAEDEIAEHGSSPKYRWP